MAEEVCIVQLDGSIGTTAKKIAGLEDGKCLQVYIQNTHASNTLYVSMSGSQHFTTITTTTRSLDLKGTSEHPIKIKEGDWRIKGSGVATTYEIILLRIKEPVSPSKPS